MAKKPKAVEEPIEIQHSVLYVFKQQCTAVYFSVLYPLPNTRALHVLKP